jgi:hypothetical protein
MASNNTPEFNFSASDKLKNDLEHLAPVPNIWGNTATTSSKPQSNLLNLPSSTTPQVDTTGFLAGKPYTNTNLQELTYKSSPINELSSRKTSTNTSGSNDLTKTIKPKIADINYTSTVSMLKTASDFLEKYRDIESGVKISLDYYNALQNSDVITSLINFYNDLNNKTLPNLKNEFVDFWVKRFHLTTEQLKIVIQQSIDMSNNSFFTELSDSIGLLVNSSSLLDDATIPITDTTTDIYKIPNILPVQIRNKISFITYEICCDLSKNNSILMRNNLQRISLTSKDANPYSNSTTNPAHGMNLITDINAFQIISNNLNSYYNTLNTNYQKISSYIKYISNINNLNGYNPRSVGPNIGTNLQTIDSYQYFSLQVEKYKTTVDLLLRKKNELLSYKTAANTLANQLTINNSYKPGVSDLTTNLNTGAVANNNPTQTTTVINPFII